VVLLRGRNAALMVAVKGPRPRRGASLALGVTDAVAPGGEAGPDDTASGGKGAAACEALSRLRTCLRRFDGGSR
jgi:hypothetical protein